jgi:hypothetical protein
VLARGEHIDGGDQRPLRQATSTKGRGLLGTQILRAGRRLDSQELPAVKSVPQEVFGSMDGL